MIMEGHPQHADKYRSFLQETKRRSFESWSPESANYMKKVIVAVSIVGLAIGALVAIQGQNSGGPGLPTFASPTPSPHGNAHGSMCTIPGAYVKRHTASPYPDPSLNELNLKDIENISKTLDQDCDGVSDHEDNCVQVWNPDQKDRNKNGIGDACENKRKPRRIKKS